MFKFLRKYNKWILAVGGTLLMIVFLIPQAIEGLAQSAGSGRATRATLVDSSGRESIITVAEWEQYAAEFELINRLSQMQPVIPIGRLENQSHWVLLSREAEQAGLVGPVGVSQVSPEMFGGDPRVASRAIAKLEGVYRLLGLYQSAGAVSDHRLREYARRMLHSAEAELVVIPASEEQSDYEPTEAELQEQLEMFADVPQGEGAMGFGYRMPDRVKVEWLAVAASSVRSGIRQSDQLNNVALQAHWMRELRNPDTTLPPMTDDPEVPDVVREHLLEKLTQEQLAAVSRFAHDRLRASRRGLQHRDGYAILPDDWDEQRMSFTQLAQEIQSRYNIETPEYHATGDQWLEFSELDDLQGIGTATTDRFGTRERDLYELVSGALEFGQSSVAQVQQGVAGPPMTGSDGSVYLFRIVDIDTSRPPHSVDEVREQLVRDVKRKDHFQQLSANISGIQEQARQNGLLATALEYDQSVRSANITLTDLMALTMQQQQGQPLTAVPSRIPVIGVNREFTEQIIDRALTLPTDVTMDEVPIDNRLFAVAAEDNLSVVVVNIKRNMPLTQDMYTQSVPLIQSLLLNEELGANRLREAFSLQSLIARHQFQLISPAGQEQEELADIDDLAVGG